MLLFKFIIVENRIWKCCVLNIIYIIFFQLTDNNDNNIQNTTFSDSTFNNENNNNENNDNNLKVQIMIIIIKTQYQCYYYSTVHYLI